MSFPRRMKKQKSRHEHRHDKQERDGVECRLCLRKAADQKVHVAVRHGAKRHTSYRHFASGAMVSVYKGKSEGKGADIQQCSEKEEARNTS